MVAVCSGKGGVGKTNISLLLGLAIVSLGKRVAIFDADLGLANVHLLLGLMPRKNLSHVANGECRIEEVIYSGPKGIGLLSGASGLEWMANPDAVHLDLLERELLKLESLYDFIIVDTPAGIGQVTVQFALQADSCLVVMTPEPTSLADAYAMVKIVREKSDRPISVVVNMARSDAEGREAFDRLSTLVVKFLKKPIGFMGTLPYDTEIPRCVKAQKSIFLERPNRPISVRVESIARELCGIPSQVPGSPFSGFLRRSPKDRNL